MALDPPVLEAIARERQAVLKNKMLALLPFFATFLALAIVIVIVSAQGGWQGQLMFFPLICWSGIMIGWLLAAIVRGNLKIYVFLCSIIASLLFGILPAATSYLSGKDKTANPWIFIGSILFAGLLLLTYFYLRTRIRYRMFAANTVEVDPAIMNTLSTDVEGASIAAGLPAPPALVILSMRHVSSTSFVGEGSKPVIALTERAVTSSLTRHEREALIAHETAHVLLRDMGRAPSVFSFELAPLILTFIFLQVIPFGLAMATDAIVIVIIFTILLAIAVPALMLSLSFTLIKRFDLLEAHNDLLADSIACRLTSDAFSLKNAIEKLAAEGLLGNVDYQTLPHRRQDGSTSRYLDAYVISAAEKEARIKNLEWIGNGRWVAFESVRDARVVLASDSWQ